MQGLVGEHTMNLLQACLCLAQGICHGEARGRDIENGPRGQQILISMIYPQTHMALQEELGQLTLLDIIEESGMQATGNPERIRRVVVLRVQHEDGLVAKDRAEIGQRGLGGAQERDGPAQRLVFPVPPPAVAFAVDDNSR